MDVFYTAIYVIESVYWMKTGCWAIHKHILNEYYLNSGTYTPYMPYNQLVR